MNSKRSCSCIDSSEIGVPGYGIAYAYPGCPLHDPWPWKSLYGGSIYCPDGELHLALSVPDTVDEILCTRCGVLLAKSKL